MNDDFFVILYLKSLFHRFFPIFEFFFNKVVYSIPIKVFVCFSFVFSCFCHGSVATCFVVNLLQWVVMSSMVSFFVSFRISSSNDKVRSDIVIRSNHVR